MRIVFVSSNLLTLQISGKGTISPNYSNAVLRVGQAYTMTATPLLGWAFTDWSGSTNGQGGLVILTNKATVAFTMFSNLIMQATFMDTNKPLVKITNAPGPLFNNAFTVMGTVTDDVAIASVNCSLNGSSVVTTTNAIINGVSWSAPLSLAGGTNIFSVYAVATNGNASVTNNLRIVFVSSNLLTLLISGKGTISPNYSNAVLRVGQAYTMTATPLLGWAFTDWSGSTNGQGGLVILTNKATVAFTMFSNLIMQATFMDTNKPLVKITNAPGPLFNNAFTVKGTVTNDAAIASVNYSLNGAGYLPAGTNAIINGVSWSAPLSLAAGTNIFSIYAMATNGNASVTNNLRIVFASSNLLTLQISGKGTISPNYSNAVLRVGQAYTMTAAGIDGFAFTNWTGGTNGQGELVVLTNKPTVAFTIFSNLIMQANFVDTNKPFLSITNAKMGMLVTNMAFTVVGRATDNVAVASVNYSLNSAPFVEAESGGGSWSAGLEMTPGTNKFSVYAMDTSGNVSATNSITLIRVPTITTFLIATNEGITDPQGRIAFDGTNYLVVFQGTNSAMGQFVSQAGALVGGPLSLNPGGSDDPPSLDFDGTNYLVAWADFSGPGGPSVKGTFVSPSGEIVNGPIPLSASTTVANFGTIVFGGGVYFIMWDDDSTTPDSIFGAMVSPSGTVTASDFLISTNGQETETGQNTAAFDGTNFLAVWYSASGNLAISGQLINPSTGPVGSPFQIFTNTASAATAVPSVLFNGTNYLVLFNIGINSANASGYHVLGRFVTPSGQVLTNQVNLTADAGPQIVGNSDFDGLNYLMTWNQGLIPFVQNTSATINARFFDPSGAPVSAEFPIFKTQGSLIPLWAPMLTPFDGTKFVLVTGLGKETGANFTFTNGVIYGAFVSP